MVEGGRLRPVAHVHMVEKHSFVLVPNEPKFYEFIRELRTHPQLRSGFLENVEITSEQQLAYMVKHGHHYHIALENQLPVGYVGIVEGDIRLAVHPDHHRKGVAAFMVRSMLKQVPTFTVRVKASNTPSLSLFRSLGFVVKQKRSLLEGDFLYYLELSL